MLEVDLQHVLGDFALDARFAMQRETGVLALTGASGAGKSSVLRCILGLLRPRAGRVLLGERVLFDAAAGIDLPVHARRIGMVFQDSRLFPHLSVRANLRYGLPAPGQARFGFDTVVQLLGIDHLLERRPRALSGGEQQRVAIGRALLTSPALLLMDEPLASLDAARKQELLPFLAALPGSVALPIVYVSHSLDEILQLADELVVMEAGRVVAQGPVAQAVRQGGAAVTVDAVLEGVVEGEHQRWVRVAPGVRLHALGLGGLPPGRRLRLRVPADDVLLAVGPVPTTSVRNHLPARVTAVRAAQRGLIVDLALEAAPEVQLHARISQSACDELALAPGRAVTAMVKAASIRLPGLPPR